MKQLKKFNEERPISGASANIGFRDSVKKSREGYREHLQRDLNSSEECLRYFVLCEEFQIEIASQDPDVHRLNLGSAMPRGGLQRPGTRSRKRDCGTGSGSSKIKKTWFVPNDAHSQGLIDLLHTSKS